MTEGENVTATNLPSGWVETTLSDVTKPRGMKVKPSEMPDAPFIGLEHIEAHTMRLLDVATTSDVKSSGSYFKQGDVIYGRLRPYLNKVYMPDFTGLASGEFIVFPNQPCLENPYLKYFLNQWEFASFATRLNAGDRPRVEFSQFADYPFPLPPLPEQRRIVAEVETQFTRLDASVASLQRAQANLKRYRASVLKAACEGTLAPTEAELARADGRDYEPAAVLLERILAERRVRWESQEKRRGKYREPSAPDTAGLPAPPEGWVWATVEHLSQLIQYGTSVKASADASGIPVLRMGNIQDGELDFSDLKYLPADDPDTRKTSLRDGDLLFNRTNSAELVGKSAVYKERHPPACFASYLIRVSFPLDVSPDYICTFINSQQGKRYIAQVRNQQVGQANVNGTKLAAMPIPLPPVSEQRRIVAEVERRLSVVQQAESAVEANLARAERLRQSILKQAFSGQLVPQDPCDEPASVLLERIRAERAAAAEAWRRKANPASRGILDP